MSADNKTPGDKRIRFPNTVVRLVTGAEDIDRSLSEEEIRQGLKESGIDLDASWQKAKKLLDAAGGRLKLEAARRERLAAAQAATPPRAASAETRESLIEQIKRLLALEPSASVYARKWEDGDLAALTSLRDQLASTSARNNAR